MTEVIVVDRIDGKARAVRELFTNRHYDVDYYQREYAWLEANVVELLDDLTGRFLDSWAHEHGGQMLVIRSRRGQPAIDNQTFPCLGFPCNQRKGDIYMPTSVESQESPLAWRGPADPTPADGPSSVTSRIGAVPDGQPPSADFLTGTPQAFLSKMNATRPALGVHYHTVDQFQIFCFGTAKFGRQHVTDGTVHYSDRLTPYGPLEPGVDGVSFLTLRAEQSSGAYYMPSSRVLRTEQIAADPRQPSSRRNMTFSTFPDTPTSAAWTDQQNDLDGLRVSSTSLDPSEASSTIRIGGLGAFIVVLRGAIAAGSLGQSLGAGSLRWAPTGSEVSVVASEDGADLVTVQFPTG